jgi:hypothetical protein
MTQTDQETSTDAGQGDGRTDPTRRDSIEHFSGDLPKNAELSFAVP